MGGRAFCCSIERWLYLGVQDATSISGLCSICGGWVGLSDITSLGGGEFLILERDNKGGPDAAIKRLYRVDIDGDADNAITAGEKTLVRDLVSDLQSAGGMTYEKVEGLAVISNGDVYIINDNDGVDDNSGETQLMNLGNILD